MKFLAQVCKLSVIRKSIIFSSLVIFPLWFFILALHFKGFLQQDWRVALGLCTVPTLVWFALTFLSSYLFEHFSKQDSSKAHFKSILPMGMDFAAYLLLIGMAIVLSGSRFDYFILLLFGYKIASLPFLKPLANL